MADLGPKTDVPLLVVDDLRFRFEPGGQDIVQGASLEVMPARCSVLLGASGCGKSTLLRLIAGLEHHQAGRIANRAKKTAFVFQSPSLMPWATVFDNVALPQRLARTIDREAVDMALEQVGLSGFAARYPSSLSGGQAMRVSIARALASGADLLLMDEPFGALDEILRFNLNDLINQLKLKHQLGILFVTHSLYEAAYLGDTIHVMDSGRLSPGYQPDFDRSQSDLRSSRAYLEAVHHLHDQLIGASK